MTLVSKFIVVKSLAIYGVKMLVICEKMGGGSILRRKLGSLEGGEGRI